MANATHFSGPVVSTNGFQNGTGQVETIAAAKTLVAADSGKSFMLNAAAGVTITLPAAVAGMTFKFTVAAVFATSNFIVLSADLDNMEGSLMVASTVVDVDAADQLNFVNSAENIGDFAELWTDGTTWFVHGHALSTGGITATG